VDVWRGLSPSVSHPNGTQQVENRASVESREMRPLLLMGIGAELWVQADDVKRRAGSIPQHWCLTLKSKGKNIRIGGNVTWQTKFQLILGDLLASVAMPLRR